MATQFHSRLQQKIEEQIQAVAASLAAGEAVDYFHYKDFTGYVRGLRDSLKFCDDVEQDMGNERSGSTPSD